MWLYDGYSLWRGGDPSSAELVGNPHALTDPRPVLPFSFSPFSSTPLQGFSVFTPTHIRVYDHPLPLADLLRSLDPAFSDHGVLRTFLSDPSDAFLFLFTPAAASTVNGVLDRVLPNPCWVEPVR